MTRKTIEVPRYLVRLPEGEVELDAREIVRRHGRGEVNFSTMVARLPGGEFHRLDEDGDFKPILCKLLNIRRLSEWNFWLMLTLSLGLFGACAFLFPSRLLFFIGYLNFFIWTSGFPGLVFGLRHSADQRDDLPTGTMIPFWGAVAAFRWCSRHAATLPPRRRALCRVLNLLAWPASALWLVGAAWLPLTVHAHLLLIVLGALYALPCAAMFALFRLDWRARSLPWRRENPPPRPRIDLLPRPEWFWKLPRLPLEDGPRGTRPAALGGALKAVLLYAAMVAVLVLNFMIAGWCLEYRVRDELPPHPEAWLAEFDEARCTVPELSSAATDFYLGAVAVPDEAVKSEVAAVRPRLAAFRKRLRAAVVDGGWKGGAEFDRYCRWRRLEILLAPPHERPSLAEESFADLEAVNNLPLYDLPLGALYWNVAQRMRVKLVEDLLTELPPRRLLAEAEFQHRADVSLAARYAFRAKVTENMAYSRIFCPLEREYGRLVWVRILLPWWRGQVMRLLLDDRPLLDRDYHDAEKALRLSFRQKVPPFFASLVSTSDLKRVSKRKAWARMVRYAVKFELERRRTGKLPEHRALPTDPFSGRPFRYGEDRLDCFYPSDGEFSFRLIPERRAGAK